MCNVRKTLCFNCTATLILVSGKKEKVMERRILKDFHIGSVENAFEQVRVVKEPQDIFTQLAKAIRSKKSEKRLRKDWNVLVKQRSLDRDPIGSTKELQNRRSVRKSVKVLKSQSSDDLLGRKETFKGIIFRHFATKS